jgi:putative FmdB family regulatory protein
MLYDYRCPECEAVFELNFPVGKAEQEAECPECGGQAKRAFTSCNFILKGGGWPSKKGRFNKEMTERNERAGRRMRKEHGDGPVRTVAHDYGDGDVREVKK